jgi:hypothetical protein
MIHSMPTGETFLSLPGNSLVAQFARVTPNPEYGRGCGCFQLCPRQARATSTYVPLATVGNLRIEDMLREIFKAMYRRRLAANR